MFSKNVSKVTEVKGGEAVLKCFKALCGEIKPVSVLDVIPDVKKVDAEFVDKQCNWTSAKHWASW